MSQISHEGFQAGGDSNGDGMAQVVYLATILHTSLPPRATALTETD